MEVKLFFFSSDTSQTTTQGASETTVPPTQDKLDDRIDGGESEKKEISAKDNTDCQPGDRESDLSETSLIRILFCFSQLTFCDSTNKTVISFLQSSVKVKTDPVRT